MNVSSPDRRSTGNWMSKNSTRLCDVGKPCVPTESRFVIWARASGPLYGRYVGDIVPAAVQRQDETSRDAYPDVISPGKPRSRVQREKLIIIIMPPRYGQEWNSLENNNATAHNVMIFNNNSTGCRTIYIKNLFLQSPSAARKVSPSGN